MKSFNLFLVEMLGTPDKLRWNLIIQNYLSPFSEIGCLFNALDFANFTDFLNLCDFGTKFLKITLSVSRPFYFCYWYRCSFEAYVCKTNYITRRYFFVYNAWHLKHFFVPFNLGINIFSRHFQTLYLIYACLHLCGK